MNKEDQASEVRQSLAGNRWSSVVTGREQVIGRMNKGRIKLGWQVSMCIGLPEIGKLNVHTIQLPATQEKN